ncbi:hypothetical protein QFC22_003752 [Naganishia vaughanmartiniae]|uniref:Uncharacterized protein n=1 Tax=Naganishia vaughanmartiniae TaxID=1424756 RepID=A0ACC2X492_9TREE|nr:hypothetical protein QFC22_003752 [Naganishia vaughanmartiniae]
MSIRVPAAQASDEDSIVSIVKPSSTHTPDSSPFPLTQVGQHQVFPTELFVVIAECLAGDQSFGSLASLNLSSHAIREETLPVLFETLTFDGKLSFFMWWKMCPGIPEGIRLTKFLITTDEPSRDLAALFPKLAMTMTIKYQHDHQTPIFSCDIYLHKPLHPVTVFSSISKTRPPPFLLVTPTVATCDPFITTGPFPPERFLNRLTLGLGAFLKPDEWVPCRGTARWTTNIVLGLTALAVDPLLAVGINDDCFIDTMCEVWKMMGSRAYNASEPSSRWLFDLRLSKPLIDKFLEKVPSVSLPSSLRHASLTFFTRIQPPDTTLTLRASRTIV